MTQNPEVPLGLAMQTAVWARDLDHARSTADHPAAARTGLDVRPTPRGSGTVAALEGRTSEAIAAFREARQIYVDHEQLFAAAQLVVETSVLLPAEAEVRSWAAEVRPLLVELRARPYLERLDEALASAPEAPSRGERTDARIAETPGA